MDQARSALREFVQSDALDAAAAAAFGPRVSGSAVAAQVLAFDRYGWPGAVVVDEHVLHGARGAYDQARDTIYVSRALLADPRASSTDVIAVLIEELGHAIDSRVNASDALGDEGAIFARFVMGEAPGSAELSGLKAENDHAAVDFGSGPVNVELAAPVVGSVTLDGSLAEWKIAEQIDKSNSTTGYDIYARSTGGSLVFALKAPVAIGANTTAWLNTDLNTATGFKIFGSAGGAEYNVNVDAAGTPRLYTGDAGQAPVSGATIPFGYSADKTVLEFAVPTSAVGSPRAVGTLWDVNNATFLPSNFSAAQYELAVPVRTDFTKKVGIVYSDTSANKYFDKMAYSQLFMAAQNQAAMAGVHYDVLTESDLTNLGKLANYDALLFPSFTHVQASQLSAIESTLRLAMEQYKVGLIASGEFMTYSQTGAALPGDPYARMKSLLGLDIVGGGFPANVTVKAGDVTHPMMLDYASNEVIHSYSGVGWLAFAPFGGTAGNVLATQTIGAQTYNAVVATTPGGRNVHFSTDEVMADNNLLWQAIDYAVNGSGISAGLQLSRQASIVASRTDMDQAMEMLDVNPAGNAQGIYDKLMPILQQWKNAYNFVGSYYIDIGNKPAQEQATDWSVSGPYYKQLLAMGNELGSHSLTHPDNTNTLTAAQFQSEFQGSKQIIEQQMSQVLGTAFTVDGAAVPGNSENLPTALSILQYYNYLSGGFSSVGAGYPGAFGYLNPAMASQNKVYLAPNVTFDFSFVEFRGLTAAQAAAAWVAEVASLVKHGEVPVMLWPWHDYGAADWPTNPPADSPYTTAMFTDFISRAYNAGSEFVTLDDLAQRISAFSGSRITTSVSGSTITATVTSADAGKFALDLDNLGTQKIASVAGWYAYDNDSVYLPRAGGSYTIRVGATADDVTRITGLPMRAELLSLSGNGTNLSFSVIGEGDVVVDLKNPAGQSVAVTGATIKSQAGEILTLGLGAIGRHDVAITLSAANQPPAITSNGGGATAAISRAENATAVTTVTATDPNAGQALTYAITGGADASKFTINAQTGALAFLVARDFEAAADQGGNNVYDVIVAARDSAGASDMQAISITVTNVIGSTLTGDSTANTLTGTREEDSISGLDGNDTLFGGFGNDTLTGGGGFDVGLFSGVRSAYLVSKKGTTYTITGPDGTDTLSDIERLQFSDVSINLRNHLVDTNLDGRNDILWRQSDGTLISWEMSGGQTRSQSVFGVVPLGWNIIDAHGDYNRDGRSDVLWQHTDGTVVSWEMTGGRTWTQYTFGIVPDGWRVIAAHDDYNLDGRSDVLWQHSDGTVVSWEMTGGRSWSQYAFGVVPSGWSVIDAAGDYNGDGRADILWRHIDGTVVSWEMTGGGTWNQHTFGVVPVGWSVVEGHGDYNGDGKNDVLWRHTDGTVVSWEMSGGRTWSQHTFGAVPLGWTVIDGQSDYNTDGKTDLLWRHSDGTVVSWEMGGGGRWNQHTFSVVPLTWHAISGDGDYNGDGASDILWKHSNGTVVSWEMSGGGTWNQHTFGVVDSAWRLADGEELGATLRGDSVANTLSGTVGRDTLYGFGGNDALRGGPGADVFVFNTVLNSATNVDTIADFVSGADRLLLSDVLFPGSGRGVLSDSNFVSGANASARDTNDFILFDTATGKVSYDGDGSGAGQAIAFAVLSNNATLTALDVQIGYM